MDHIHTKIRKFIDDYKGLEPPSFINNFYSNLEILEIYDAKTGETNNFDKSPIEVHWGAKDPRILGTVLYKFSNVDGNFSNQFGNIHGGAIVTWVDIVTSAAITGFDMKNRRIHVSLSLSTDFINAGKI